MATRQPVVVLNEQHTPLPAADKLPGGSVSISTDADNIMSIDTDDNSLKASIVTGNGLTGTGKNAANALKVLVDPAAGNALMASASGLKVDTTNLPYLPTVAHDTSLTGTGESATPLAVALSASDNQLVLESDGLRVAPRGRAGGLIGVVEYITDHISVPADASTITVEAFPDTLSGAAELWETFKSYPYWYIDVTYTLYYNVAPITANTFNLAVYPGLSQQLYASFAHPLDSRNAWFDNHHLLYPMLYTPGLGGVDGGHIMGFTNQTRPDTPSIPISIRASADQAGTQTVPYDVALVTRCMLYGSES